MAFYRSSSSSTKLSSVLQNDIYALIQASKFSNKNRETCRRSWPRNVVWRLDEEAKIEFTITVNWHREDGSIAKTQLGTLKFLAKVREP